MAKEKNEAVAAPEIVPEPGKGPAAVPPEPPVSPTPEEPTIPKTQYTNLQKAHEEAKRRIEALEGDQGRLQKLEDGFSILRTGLEMQQAETTASTIIRYIEEGNTEAADALADREMSRQLASRGLTWDDPALVNVAAVRQSGAAKAYPHFISVQPALGLRQPATLAPVSSAAPPVETSTDLPVAEAETIGGKTLDDLKKGWAIEAGLMNPATPTPAGIGADVNAMSGEQILKMAVEQKDNP